MSSVEVGSSWDWQNAFGVAHVHACEGYTGSISFSTSMIAKIHRAVEGENDGDSWECVGELHDGRWFFLTAWCDYTGWGCQDGGNIYIGANEDMVRQLGCDAGARERLYGEGVGSFPIEWL